MEDNKRTVLERDLEELAMRELLLEHEKSLKLRNRLDIAKTVIYTLFLAFFVFVLWRVDTQNMVSQLIYAVQ